MVSPVKSEELILGKTLPYVLICLVTMVLILLMGYVLFDVVIRGSLVLLSLATVCFLFAALGMGVLVSSVTRSQQMAFQIAILASLLPSIILSGLIFPIKNMPWPIQGLTLIVVPRYFVAALRKIILKGAPLADIWPELLAMLGLGVLFNLLAAHFTRKAV
jgi:ABC-2 type transport system permease protein